MELVDRGEQPLDLVARGRDVRVEERVGFVAAVDLRLEVADRAVDVAGGARRERRVVRGVFELLLELRDPGRQHD